MKIALVGGGTAGHIVPNQVISQSISGLEPTWQVFFISSNSGFEKDLFKNTLAPVYYISSGKLRRYFDIKNFSDPFKILLGVFQSVKILHKHKPDIVFLKGGFTCVPVGLACRILRIPFVIHESDASLGLANKILSLFTKHVWYSSLSFKSPKSNFLHIQLPLKADLKQGDAKAFMKKHSLSTQKPSLLVIGGSSGAKALNDFIFANFKTLIRKFNIIHVLGKINVPENIPRDPSYLTFDFLPNLKDVYATADYVLSRAGAITLQELEEVSLKAILVPLPDSQSRGDQQLNAQDFVSRNPGEIVEQSQLTLTSFQTAIQNLDQLSTGSKQSKTNNPKHSGPHSGKHCAKHSGPHSGKRRAHLKARIFLTALKKVLS